MKQSVTLLGILFLFSGLSQLGAQDFSTYANRCRYVNDVLAGPAVSGSWGTYTLAKLEHNPDDAKALDEAVRNVTRLDNQSVPIGAIALGLHWDHFSSAQRDTMKNAMKSWREVNGHGTENHALMQNASAYLFSQWFPGESGWTLNSGDSATSEELNSINKKNLTKVASSLYDKGYCENLSTTYLMLHVYPWMMVHQFSDDEEFRNVANAAIHFHVANLAANNFHGQVISPYNRSNVQQQNRPVHSDSEGKRYVFPQVPFLSWLYWAQATHYNDPAELGSALKFYHGMLGFYANMNWGPPPEVLQRIGAGQGVPYVLKSTSASFGGWGSGTPHENLRTVYRTADYAVGTGFFRYKPPEFYTCYNNFGIFYESADKFNVVECNHNYWLSDEDESYRWNHCVNSIFQQDAHHENTVISLFNIPATDPWVDVGRSDWCANRDGHYSNLIQRADVRYPKNIDEKAESDGWVFLREGDVYIGIKPLRGYSLDATSLADFDVLNSPGAANAIVFEVGAAEQHGSFAAFQSALKANALNVNWDTLTVEYTNSDGVAIAARWTQPDYAKTGRDDRVLVKPEVWINRQRQPDYAAEDWPVLASPHVNLKDRILSIEQGGDSITVDWTGQQPVFTHEAIAKVADGPGS